VWTTCVLQFVIRVIEAGDHERDNFQPESISCSRRIAVQDRLQPPAELVIVRSSKLLGQLCRGQPRGTGYSSTCGYHFRWRQRPSTILLHGLLKTATAHSLVINGSLYVLTRTWRLDEELAVPLLRGAPNGETTAFRSRSAWTYPILAIGTVQVTAQHSEAVRQAPGCAWEDGFFSIGRLHYTGRNPRGRTGSASVVANLADARLALRDGAAVTTSKTAYPVAVKFLVEFPRGHSRKQYPLNVGIHRAQASQFPDSILT